MLFLSILFSFEWLAFRPGAQAQCVKSCKIKPNILDGGRASRASGVGSSDPDERGAQAPSPGVQDLKDLCSPGTDIWILWHRHSCQALLPVPCLRWRILKVNVERR